jgi:imidazolonepropionase-like amidohydrolase
MTSGGPDRTGGFVDVHVHITNPDALRDLAAAGIVAARDAGSKQGVGLMLRRISAVKGAPRIVSAGKALAKKGGYGAFLGVAVETREEIAGEIGRLANEGADIIKVIASGAVDLKRPGTVTAGGFGSNDLWFIVEESGKHGLAVMAHANGETAIRAAAEAGVRSVEHGFLMSDAALRSLAQNNVYWVPTVGALRRAVVEAKAGAATAAIIEQEITRHLSMLGKAFRGGVLLAVGTDAVLPDERYGQWYDDELMLFREAGIPAEAVARIASEGGSKLLGI